ncbi:hypothetical protein AB0H94_16760 [Streptomyces purpurascens]|uniref:hypothetical protein n=1 Tax=Streptomyces purpurascens TaxID=1924 RepID=UPI0033E8A0CC
MSQARGEARVTAERSVSQARGEARVTAERRVSQARGEARVTAERRVSRARVKAGEGDGEGGVGRDGVRRHRLGGRGGVGGVRCSGGLGGPATPRSRVRAGPG